MTKDEGERHEPRQPSPAMAENRNMTECLEGNKKMVNMICTYPLANLISEIASIGNVEESFDYVVGHLEHVEQKEKYRSRRTGICDRLQAELASGTFKVTEYRNMRVRDGPKERMVQVTSVYDRIGCHAVMSVIERHAYPTLVKNTASSIKGRGMHWLHHIVEDDMRNVPELTRYYYQCDVRHYYDSISQEKMKALVREYVADPVVLRMLDNFIGLLPTGLSKGLRSSQCFANLFLNKLDHKMQEEAGRYFLVTKDGIGVRSLYYRYCDDIVMLADSKKKLWRMRNILVEEMAALGLTIKPSEAVRPLSEGLDFLGYKHYGTHSLLRKRTKQNAARKLARVKSRKRRQAIIGSFKGMACHADCKHLYYILTGQKMKKFSELGITYTPKDGKKRFPGKTYRLAVIQNKSIEVRDFEVDMDTSHGNGRYLVSFRDIQTGEWGKFFTTSEELKSILNQAREQGVLPFETVMVGECFDGNKIKYCFT